MRLINSPVKRWPGHVVLPDVLTFPQLFALDDSWLELRKLGEETTKAKQRFALLPGILVSIQEWHLNSGFPDPVTLDNFPASPDEASHDLVFWLSGELAKLRMDNDTIPNA